MHLLIHLKIPNLNAGSLRNNLVAKEKKLETNLFNVMGAVRASKEYWCQRATDLKAFDENFGAATWFFTISSAEYHWEDLRSFLLSMSRTTTSVLPSNNRSMVHGIPLHSS